MMSGLCGAVECQPPWLTSELTHAIAPEVCMRRDKTRMLLAEALSLAAGAVPGADAGAIAVEVEVAMLRQVRLRHHSLAASQLKCVFWWLPGHLRRVVT